MRYLNDESGPENHIAAYRLSIVTHYLLWALLVLLISRQVLFPALASKAPFGILHEKNFTIILDFPSIFNFAKAFWLEHRYPGISAYSVENNLRVTSAWSGEEFRHSMPFGYSPTMLWLLAPLVHFSHAIAFCIFNIAGLLAVWWQTRPARCRFGLGLLAFLSPLALTCFLLGQTALLTGTGLLFLFERSRNGFKRIVSWQTILSGLALWALSAKPPLALTAGMILLGLRQWQPVLLASLLALATTLAISPMLGPRWITDYLHLLATYNQLQADPAYSWCYFPQHMANLRGVLNADFNLPDDIACRLSSFIWLSALAGLVAAGPRLHLTFSGFWSVGVLLYLLFCPHVSSYEVLQVVLLLPFCIPLTNKLDWKELVLLFTVPLLPFLSPVQLDNRILLFSGLLFLLGFVCTQWQEKARNSVGTP